MSSLISASSSKRLAKNTLLLYVRSTIVMAITLFTSRIVLASLGIEDYGTYNAVGGFVALFSMLGGTLVSATQRFINYELGKTENQNVNKIFCTAMAIHASIAVVTLILFESFGLWFLNCRMNFPEGRLIAANVVFQTSVVSFLLNIFCLPFIAVIVAYERMKAFAYVSLLDAVLKLAISYGLFFSDGDRLVLYAVLLLCVSIMNQLMYVFYCKKFFSDIVEIHLVKEKDAYIKQTSFAGLTFLENIAFVLSNQGISLILNLFCGVSVNAARSITVHVQNAVTKFVYDFMTALNPQITKTYAAGELDKSMSLVCRGAKFAYYLVLVLSVPIFFKTPEILKLWLNVYPDYAVVFIQLTLIASLFQVINHPLNTEIFATGQIRVNVLIVSCIRFLSFPISYVFLKLGYAPYCAYIVIIVINIVCMFARLYAIQSITGFKMMFFLRRVLLYVLVVTAFIGIANIPLTRYMSGSISLTFLYIVVSLILSSFIVWFIGVSADERRKIVQIVLKKNR